MSSPPQTRCVELCVLRDVIAVSVLPLVSLLVCMGQAFF